MIKLENVSKSFGDVRAVDGVSLEIPTGQVLGFLGPNGAGKTTTLRMVTGFLAPDNGAVFVGGVNVEKHPKDAQKLIGYLPENNPLYKDIIVSDLMEWVADLRGVPKQKRYSLFDSAVSAANIEDVFYRPVGDLSKGYKQRVGLALALLSEPQILILDEPTEGLDPNQRREIKDLIKELGKERTIILSTHVMQEARSVCDKIAIIHKGKIVAQGTPRDLSQKTGEKKVISVEVEGENVRKALKGLLKQARIKIGEAKPNRFRVKITTKKSVELRPEISRLVTENNWTIWHVSEKEHGLEEVFRKLTK